MNVFRMMLREAWGRKAGTLLGIATVVLVTGLCVGAQMLFDAGERDATKLGKSMGFNLVYLPKDTDMAFYRSHDHSDKDMPDSYAEALVKSGRLEADHFSAKLERRIDWEGRSVLLTGVRKTVARGGKEPLGFKKDIEPGTAQVGGEIGALLEKEAGRKLFDQGGRLLARPDGSTDGPVIAVLGEKFRVAERRPRGAPKDDIRINVNLKDGQRLLQAPGKINAIEGLSCVCVGGSYTQTMEVLESLLPEARLDIPDKPKWMQREELRAHQKRFAMAMFPALLLVSAALVAAMAYLNVRQRREEIGLLRAVGTGSLSVGALFISKAVLTGLVGAALGFAVGTVLARSWGPGIFDLKPGGILTNWWLLLWALAAAPLLTALAAAGPAMFAVYLDPAEALRQE
jgi:putative ABC transport system permease protein